ncbi:UPAR/Ly6 domain-containing protein bou-like isoform X2 [Tachypleus tridentatus]|uniref:UPAR/Ly6 domain-containing protein bou-like isoform X2 n=1 Tax=Tachypleus tridentatus TaxID=6853 RepID=UPI003FD623E0
MRFNEVFAIRCYRCESNTDMHCSEDFHSKYSQLEPQSCDDIFESQFCVKTTGMYEGEIGTKRFCSSRHHGNYCEYIRRPGDDREYRSCVYTCSGDGCNIASSWKKRSTNSILLSAFLIIVTRVLFGWCKMI